MRFRRIQATLIAAVMMANGLAPAITISAAEQTAQSETTSTAESGPFYTYTNEVKNGTSSEVTKNVTTIKALITRSARNDLSQFSVQCLIQTQPWTKNARRVHYNLCQV